MTLLKICGIREPEHALVAEESGANFLGFVFVPGVRRQLSHLEGKRIIDTYRKNRISSKPKIVGLFANQPVETVNYIAKLCGLDMVQLCGDETIDYLNRINTPIIRQIKVGTIGDTNKIISDVAATVDRVVENGHSVSLDSHQEGTLGGTGRTFDWSIAKEIAKHHNFLLAGGLNPDNIDGALDKVDPWGVDVSSGVETNGIKDIDKIIDFARRVHDH